MTLHDRVTQNGGGSFIYTSPYHSLQTSGCFATIETSAHDGQDPAGNFQQQLSAAFAEAKSAGIRNPVVVGAIPFDTTQPSALFIPEHVQFFSRNDHTHDSLNHSRAPIPPVTTTAHLTPSRQVFEDMVSQGIAATRQGDVEKVVLSRIVDITTRDPLDALDLFQRLVAQNPASYNFHVPLPDGGSLVGASPELLLRLEDNGTFTSHPLAGSARRSPHDARADRAAGQALLSSRKDRHEHSLVVDAVRAQLAPRAASLLTAPSEPELVATPTLWHLGTRIAGSTATAADNALSLACLLHPTPALSGAPHAAARGLIRDLEPFDRGLFGGLVGWCDADGGNGEWAVAIRCARVRPGGPRRSTARLFAGAGIVPASDPAAEWRETEAKLATMLDALGLSGAVRTTSDGGEHGRASL
ncbi:uncharacterized protein E0L32_009539 [Thyridium curvatum]|uniref:isochorismate synthase n=1 Tax=Thyridium curvatum TaxID=1093900 RepID=A0A507AXE1_9PEZI|nr:uncharacterized protein E0L32_009539 [Thyridium curvatum]TPX08960.1 hypothetical protein E0L32_009539 [Thyridium curvatum]